MTVFEYIKYSNNSKTLTLEFQLFIYQCVDVYEKNGYAPLVFKGVWPIRIK